MKPIIEVRNLSKKYKIGAKQKRYLSLRDQMVSGVKEIFNRNGKSRPDDFYALKDVSFNIYPGDTLGIIGRNGAGKSTLLKILSKITPPTSGSVKLRGRVASLLEVGTGFHPELTGRENIFLNGAILGMKHWEVKKQFDEIVNFSGVEQFLDTPLKHYSSGMQLRLAFAVAAHLEPEILLIDEVLAVGDAEFQKKCLGKMDEVSKSGRTVLFVSHNLGAIEKLCKRVMIINSGKLTTLDKVNVAIKEYETLIPKSEFCSFLSSKKRVGTGDFRFLDISIVNKFNRITNVLTSGEFYQFRIRYQLKNELKKVVFKILFYNKLNQEIIFTCCNLHSANFFDLQKKEGIITCCIPRFPLNTGQYYISLRGNNNFVLSDKIDFAIEFSVDRGDYFKTGRMPPANEGILVNHFWKLN